MCFSEPQHAAESSATEPKVEIRVPYQDLPGAACCQSQAVHHSPLKPHGDASDQADCVPRLFRSKFEAAVSWGAWSYCGIVSC